MIDGEITETMEIFGLLWNLQIFNVNVMFTSNGSIMVKTFMPFNARKCHDTSSVLINEFRSGKFIRGLENFFPDKMKNLHSCPIRLATINDIEPFMFAERLTNGSFHLKGRDIDMLNALSVNLNFKIVYT